ncbi:MAG: hypothetical protein J3R72DRAFT_465325 [Linnemannia gamsii]|nr:MAG: hypothetical protein J3R72DRAFT_465325 [Linnemannia gamsii]
MPRATTCTFSLIGRVDLNKSQRNHLLSYHKDTPVIFICPTQKACERHGLCRLCGNVFTLNTNFRRHYEACQVAADTVRSSSDYAELIMDVDNNTSSSSSSQVAPSSVVCEPTSQPLGQAHTSDSAYKPTRQSARLFKTSKAVPLPQRRDLRSSTTSKVLNARPPKQAGSIGALGIPLKSRAQEHPAIVEPPSSSSFLQFQHFIVEQHQHYLQSSSLQHSQILTALTDHHHLFLKSLNKGTRDQHQQLLKTMNMSAMEQNRLMRSTFAAFTQSTITQQSQVLETMSGHHRELLHSMSDQHSQLLQTLSEQHHQLLRNTGEHHRQIISTTTEQHHSTTKKIEETRSAMEGISEHQRENTHTLAAQERVLDQLTMYNLAL